MKPLGALLWQFLKDFKSLGFFIVLAVVLEYLHSTTLVSYKDFDKKSP